MDQHLIYACALICTVSFAWSLTIITYSSYVFNRRSRVDELAVQSAHQGPVPRAGGFAICLSIMIFLFLSAFEFNFFFTSIHYKIGNLGLLFVSGIPIFLVGLIEDLGYAMSPKKRLIAAIVSGVLVIMLFEVWVNRIGIVGIDFVLSVAPIAIIFTLFATTGVVNAFNLIDGLNGLTGYISVSCAVALSILAYQVDNSEIFYFYF